MTPPRGPRWPRAAWATALRLGRPLYAARLKRRGRDEPGYLEHLPQRFGHDLPPRPVPAGGAALVWLHAVSLGETRAAQPLVDALRVRQPGIRFWFTHGTATGRAAGAALQREGDAVSWLPYDTPEAVERFLAHVRPDVGVLMETEIWPALQHAAAERGVPTVLANARLSERSARQGRRFAALLRPAVGSLALALAQTEDDAARLRSAGARDVRVMGNLKHDMQPDAALLARGRAWRAAARAAGVRRVAMMASSREGEEAPLLADWKAHAQAGDRLLLVPRHPQRFDSVASWVAQAGLGLARRSTWGDAGPDAQALAQPVWLGDSLGEMAQHYGMADIALLGGSFEPLGGQNLIEGIACGCPMLLGPHTFNFAEASVQAIEAGAAWRTMSIESAVERALNLPEADLATARERGEGWLGRHAGASGRMADAVLELTGRRSPAQR